jgi:hypothetical protein
MFNMFESSRNFTDILPYVQLQQIGSMLYSRAKTNVFQLKKISAKKRHGGQIGDVP